MVLPSSSEYCYMQLFATREAAVSNNKHDAFSALDGENLALVQSIQLHEPDFLLSPACRSLYTLVPLATAQSALKYLLGTPGRLPPRQRAKAPAGDQASSLTPGRPWLLPGLNLVCHKNVVRMCVRSSLAPGAHAAVEDERALGVP